jgi:hypothetical protein
MNFWPFQCPKITSFPSFSNFAFLTHINIHHFTFTLARVHNFGKLTYYPYLSEQIKIQKNIYLVQKVREGINISPYPLYAPYGYKDKQKLNRIFTQMTLFQSGER